MLSAKWRPFCLSLNVLNENQHLTEHKTNKFAPVCDIWGGFEWGLSEITKVDRVSS